MSQKIQKRVRRGEHLIRHSREHSKHIPTNYRLLRENISILSFRVDFQQTKYIRNPQLTDSRYHLFVVLCLEEAITGFSPIIYANIFHTYVVYFIFSYFFAVFTNISVELVTTSRSLLGPSFSLIFFFDNVTQCYEFSHDSSAAYRLVETSQLKS